MKTLLALLFWCSIIALATLLTELVLLYLWPSG
jgi:hypothetical protein